jgi:murein DD-endopeptidase
VIVQHLEGVRTFYAHLSKILVSPGQHLSRGTPVGLVGQSGEATGPHLHFEVRVRDAAVDPATAVH